MTIDKKMEVFNMIKEGKTCNAIACHFGVNRSTIFRIKKAEKRIRKTTKITVNRSVKKPLILMESALITWKENLPEE